MLVKNQKILDREGECFDDLAGSGCLMRGHKFVKFTEVQKEAACFQELAAKIIKTLFVATKV